MKLIVRLPKPWGPPHKIKTVSGPCQNDDDDDANYSIAVNLRTISY